MLKGITYQILIKMVKEIFELIMPKLSESIKQMLSVYLNDLYRKAKETSNFWDDFFVELLADVLGIELEGKQ
jgi:hypothetical protein